MWRAVKGKVSKLLTMLDRALKSVTKSIRELQGMDDLYDDDIRIFEIQGR